MGGPLSSPIPLTEGNLNATRSTRATRSPISQADSDRSQRMLGLARLEEQRVRTLPRKWEGRPGPPLELRAIRRANPGRTLGGQQVGKAAIAGWREVILPALRDEAIDAAVWPFDGSLEELLSTRSIVLCETYPADAYSYLGVDLTLPRTRKRASKRDQSTRARQASTLLAWAQEAKVERSADLLVEIRDGFGKHPDGEDRFDAVVGLFGMLEVVAGGRAAGNPASREVNDVEGWVLGQACEAEICPS